MTLKKASVRAGGGVLVIAGLSMQLMPLALAAPAIGDLSQYRGFHLGSDLASVAKSTETNVSQVKVVHKRPALIQELEWRPRNLWSAQSDPARQVTFSFYDGHLYQIAIDYESDRTEGMTPDDLIQAISAKYGPAEKHDEISKSSPPQYGEQGNLIAQWQNPEYRFDLLRFSYGPTYRLVGVAKNLEASAQTAIAEAVRLDEKDAPRREAARVVTEQEAEQAKLAKSRITNKPAFRP